jgi:hypothetical protein
LFCSPQPVGMFLICLEVVPPIYFYSNQTSSFLTCSSSQPKYALLVGRVCLKNGNVNIMHLHCQRKQNGQNIKSVWLLLLMSTE